MSNNIIQTGNWFVDNLNLYQSANSDNASIKNNFVIRQAEFEIIISELANKSDKDPLQHELILGRRGSGKSTLLRRIQAEIEENTKLQKKYIAINFAEEQAGIYRLFDLWDEVLKELAIKFNVQLVLKNYKEFNEDEDAFTRYLYENINELLVKQKRKAVLLLDNFDRIIGNFNDDGNLLREILLNYNDIQIIAGSTRMDEHFWQYDKPFYEFFRRHRLEALSKVEIIELLTLWSKVMNLPELADFAKKNIGKIEAIRILTDGLPRTLQFFIQILLQNANLYGYDYLRKVMDNVSAQYQERLNNLPALQRKIVLEMAFIWEACSTKDLVEKCKIQSKLISAQIKRLSDIGIIDIITTSKKNHLYRISERFFNMWLIVTQGNPEQKRKAKWLSIFLETWYDREELKQLATDHIGNLENNKIGYDKALVFTKAFSQSKYVTTKQRDRFIDLTNAMQPNGVKNCLIELPKKYEIINDEVQKFIKQSDFVAAHKLIDEIENEEDGKKFFLKGLMYSYQGNFKDAERYYLLSIEKKNFDTYNNLAVLYNIEDNAKAEKYFLLAIEKGDETALSNLGVIYYKRGNEKKAEKYFLLAIEKGNFDALNNLGNLYFDQKKYNESEKYFLLAIEKEITRSLNDLGILYGDIQNYKDAEKYFLLAIEKSDINAQYNLARLYHNQKNYLEAEKYYLLSIEKGEIKALNNLATIYAEQERYIDAEKYFLMAIEKGHIYALNNLAYISANQKKYSQAEKYYLMSIEKGNIDTLYDLAIMYNNQNNETAAEKYYLLAIKKGHTEALFTLAVFYYDKNIKKVEAAELIESYNLKIKDNKITEQVIIILDIWSGKFDNLSARIEKEITKNEYNDLETFFSVLLCHEQLSLVLEFFTHKVHGLELQKRYNPLYYAVQILNNKMDDNLELRIPPEIMPTVNDIIKDVKEMQQFYAAK